MSMRVDRSLPIVLAVFAFLPAASQSVVDATLHVETVVTGLSFPTTMAFVGSNDILALQKGDGQVRRVLGGTLQAGNVLDVKVANATEQGLLGIATDPDFVNNAWVYLYYTESTVDAGSALGNRVYRYTWNGSALVTPVLVLDLPTTPGTNHDGGVIAFGPDDKLYAVIGDLNRDGKLQNYPLGPDPDETGAILRVNPDGTAPPDNPWFDPLDPSDGLNRTYAYGVRNSFGLGFDPVTGNLWDTENGPETYDEINRVPRGFNSGWERLMGPDSRDPNSAADLWSAPGSAYSDPEFSWVVTVAPTAVAFVGSPRLGCTYVNDLIVGDNNCGQLYRFDLTADRSALALAPPLADFVADNESDLCLAEQSQVVFGSGFGAVTDAEIGPDGRLYVVSLRAGAIYRVVRTAGSVPDVDGDEVEDSCDCAPANAGAYAPPVEVPRLRLSGTAPSLGWDAQNAATGSATSYTVVSGDLSDLRADAGFASACRLGSELTTTKLVDGRVAPSAGNGTYYLVRAGNACSNGTYGNASGPSDPRDALDASSPPVCP